MVDGKRSKRLEDKTCYPEPINLPAQEIPSSFTHQGLANQILALDCKSRL